MAKRSLKSRPLKVTVKNGKVIWRKKDKRNISTKIKVDKQENFFKSIFTSPRNQAVLEKMKERVGNGRRIQNERYRNEKIRTNSELNQQLLKKYCKVSRSSASLLKDAFNNLGLSARSYKKIIIISRTIADLEGCQEISERHIAEAIQYRSLDRKKWAY